MPKDPFFSIVMPVYRVERYLEQSVESVLAQSLGNLELILVDDASPDGCPVLCDALAQKDGRIRVRHLSENGGVSNARNVGLDLARGRYLMFMDSDDTIEPGLLEEAAASLQENPAKLVLFGMTEELYDEAGRLTDTRFAELPQQYFYDRQSLREYMIEVEKSTLYGYACNKFYDLAYLRSLSLRYREYALNEDILFNIAYCMEIDSMNILHVPAYHYRKVRDGQSRTGQFVAEYFDLHVKKMEALYRQFGSWGVLTDAVCADLASIYTRYILSALQRNCDPRAGMKFSDRRSWIQRLYEQPLFQELIPYGNASNYLVHFLNDCLKKHRTLTCLCVGRMIDLAKRRLPTVFEVFQRNR